MDQIKIYYYLYKVNENTNELVYKNYNLTSLLSDLQEIATKEERKRDGETENYYIEVVADINGKAEVIEQIEYNSEKYLGEFETELLKYC